MFTWNADACWHALQGFWETSREKNKLEEIDLGHASRIIEALARQPHECREHVLAVLSGQSDKLGHMERWLRPFIADLAGEMRLHTAIPSLVGNLGYPGYLSQRSLVALIKIGGEDVVKAVQDQYHHASREFRLDAGDLLGEIHEDSAVQCALDFLPRESDLEIRTSLCQSLIDNFSLDCVEPAHVLIKHEKLNPGLRQLRSNLIAACKILETRFPEFDSWREQAKQDAEFDRAQMREIMKMTHEAGGDMQSLVQILKADIAAKKENIKRMAAQIVVIAEKAKALTARSAPRAAPLSVARLPERRELGAAGHASRNPVKPGRNDPCPCGSGKKFKKCCLKN